MVFLVGEKDDPQPIFNVTTETWSWITPIPASPLGVGDEAEVALAGDGYVYQFEGAVDTTVIRYDPVANVWDPERVADLVDFYAVNAIGQTDGSIQIFTGGSVVSFDPATRATEVLMTEDMLGGWAEPFANGALLALTGGNGSDALCVDPSLGATEPYPPAPFDLFSGSVGAGPDGRIYAFSCGIDSLIWDVWAFDFDVHAWVPAASPAVEHCDALVITGPDDRLYLIGGGVDDPTAVEVFEPAN
jgi:hypothetical protein